MLTQVLSSSSDHGSEIRLFESEWDAYITRLNLKSKPFGIHRNRWYLKEQSLLNSSSGQYKPDVSRFTVNGVLTRKFGEGYVGSSVILVIRPRFRNTTL
ncbi:hypothetical protein AVEN_67172-1 [Araneus ventricosus]|uniref:Uncharacterized protein n=1 Tax=Araneus ventricosus TaxID=182803 RepID=A0A4Y2EHD6_ARAVE|nr:hypothetical protein AVEN_67172-1 [Araneus ventricosus]